MRYVIAVAVLAILIAKLVSVGRNEHEIMMQEIKESDAWLDAYNKSQIGNIK